MRRVIVDVPTKTVKVQGSCNWENGDGAAGQYNLAMVGGTVNHTGVGRLTLGGVYGWLFARYGLTIDSQLSLQIVLADCSIKAASIAETRTSSGAARGAGHCFGVVVEFAFKVKNQKNTIWAGQLTFPSNQKLDDVVAFAYDCMSTSDGDSGMVVGITAPPFMSESAMVTTLFRNGSKAEANVISKRLLDMEPLRKTTQERPYTKMNGLMNPWFRMTDESSRKVLALCPIVT